MTTVDDPLTVCELCGEAFTDAEPADEWLDPDDYDGLPVNCHPGCGEWWGFYPREY